MATKFTSVRKSVLTAVMVALCVVLPGAFHSVGLGSTFAPMHIPVLMCGLLCGSGYGLVWFCSRDRSMNLSKYQR